MTTMQSSAVLLSLLLGASVVAEPMSPKREEDAVYTAKVTEVGITILKEMSKNKENTIVCPFIIYNALASLLLGSENRTSTELSSLLHLSKSELYGYGCYSASIIDSFNFTNYLSYDVTLSHPSSTHPLTTYADTASKYFQLLSKPVEPSVLSHDDDTGLPFFKFTLVGNARFLSKWKEPFHSTRTYENDFHDSPNGKVRSHFMREDSTYKYCEDELLQAVSIPYNNSNYAMVIILPRRSDGLAALLKNCDYKFILGTIHKLSQREGHIEVPKTKISRKDSLNRYLIASGVKSAFDSKRAAFSSMWPDRAYIQDVSLTSSLEVNEEETVAANRVEILGGILGGVEAEVRPPKPFSFIANHPFLFIIYDYEHQLPTFIGVIYEP